MAPYSSTLAWKIHGLRSLVGCSPWGLEESDTTERLHFHFSLSCIGEGNGNPLQCSCLENPRDGGAWWAAVYVVTQSRTRLKRLSSSSSRGAVRAVERSVCQGDHQARLRSRDRTARSTPSPRRRAPSEKPGRSRCAGRNLELWLLWSLE